MGKMLLINFQGLGNTVLMFPLLKELRRHNRNVGIDMLVRDPIIPELLAPENVIDNFLIYLRDAKGIELFKSRISVLKDIRGKFYDRAINFEQTQTLNSIILMFMIKAKEKIGINAVGKLRSPYHYSVTFSPQQSESDLYKGIGELSGCGSFHLSFPFFSLAEDDVNRVSELLPNKNRTIIGIHPGSGVKMLYKRWPKERFAELSHRLVTEKGVSVVIFGGHREIALGEAILKQSNTDHIYNLAGKLTIRETAAAVIHCSRIISNDSGIMHLAAAMGVSVISLFGPTSAIKNAPVGENNRLLCGPGCCVSSNEMCPECHQAWESESKIPHCLENLKVEAVLDAV